MPNAPTRPEFDPKRDKVIAARRVPKRYLKKRPRQDGGGYPNLPRVDQSPPQRRRLASDSSSGNEPGAVASSPRNVRAQVS